MAIDLQLKPLAAAAVYKVVARFTNETDGLPLSGITEVLAVLVDTANSTETTTEITAPIPFTPNGDTYKGIFPAAETAKLLSDPADPNSPVQYERVYLFFQIARTDADGDPITHTLCSKAITVSKAILAA